MSESAEVALRQLREELQMLYDGSTEGILTVDIQSQRFVRANRAICELLGYSKEELLSLSIADIHPPESLPEVQKAFESQCQRRLKCARNIPCRRKDGSVLYVDIAANYLSDGPPRLLTGFFRDVTEQTRTAELLRASEDRYRLVADHVNDMIWTSPISLSDAERAMAKVNVAAVVDAVMDRFRFSYVSPAASRVLGYTAEEAGRKTLRDITRPAAYAHIRDVMIGDFMRTSSGTDDRRQDDVLEIEMLAKDGTMRWCEVVSAYLRDEEGFPTSLLGITRDISRRRQAEQALRESESKLRSLFENLPDFVVTVDRRGIIQFVNRGTPDVDREALVGRESFGFLLPEHAEAGRHALEQAFVTGSPQTVETLDIFSRWWASRVVPLVNEDSVQQAMVICTDVTQERLAAEAVGKEQQLLRQLLELHERERKLTAYELHDGFAQQLAGALFRLQGFRETHARTPERAWSDFDSAIRLITRAIDETRRLISGLRPPILDESGILQAVEYLAYEHGSEGGPEIEFTHEVSFDRLAPPLESGLFRIVQELLHNACRHSRSDRIRIHLGDHDHRIHLDVRDWGVGFNSETIEEHRFGLQGIRERVRLLDGTVVIESALGKGTHVVVELPLIESAAGADDEPDSEE
jgi:PAS domain S-box-containing protein